MSTKFIKLFMTTLALSLTMLFPLTFTSAANTTGSDTEAYEFIISGANSITQDNSYLKLRATFGEADVTSASSWYISNGGKYAFVNSDGLVSPLADGVVTVSASYTDADGTTFSASKIITITNQTVPHESVSVDIGVASMGYIIKDKGLDTEQNLYTGFKGDYPAGTKFNLTALETKYDFLYWKDVNSSKILSTDKTFEFTVGSDMQIQAVFRNSTERNFVMFRDANDYIIQNEYVGSANIDVPKTPTMPGYIFSSWLLGGIGQTFSNNQIDVSTLTEDRIYNASYTQQSNKYTVNVCGGSGSGKYKYDDKVSVILDETAIPDGKTFACWTKDGAVVSYNKLYTFHVSGDTNICAVYSSASLPQKSPILTMTTPYVSGKNITFISERSLPLDYTFIETGILVSMNSTFDIDTLGISHMTSTSTNGSGQFSIRKTNASSGNSYYAKAYMIYEKDGVVQTIYSNIVSITL